jgi:gentisate 1,2-dioxygenase
MKTPETAPDEGDPQERERRQAWAAASVRPLWESPVAHQSRRTGRRSHLWKWRQLEPIVADALEMTSPAAVERRVISLVDPNAEGPAAGTTTNLTAALQVLKPGETARPHRHTMNAIRFVLQGDGAVTKVDGKTCRMAKGDLILTPGWTWHEHTHNGSAPIVWLDALDGPLHRYLGTDVFEPGPSRDIPEHLEDAAFAFPNLMPQSEQPVASFSPVFRYPWADAAAAVQAAPVWKDRSRRIRYVNPVTGGSAMPLIDCYMCQIGGATETIPFRTTSNAVCVVVEGRGITRSGDLEMSWETGDIFSLPNGNWISHRTTEEPATLFLVTDRDVLHRLGLLKEEYGNASG